MPVIEIDSRPDERFEETSFIHEDPSRAIDPTENLPTVPKTLEEQANDLRIEEFISNVRRLQNVTKELDKSIYLKLTIDNDGYISYNNKRVSKKGSTDILSINTLNKNADGREFLRKLGYLDRLSEEIELQTVSHPVDRDLETVSPDQVLVINEKIKSFKTTEEWAKKEKQKAQKQLLEATSIEDKNKMQELVTYYDHLELQARRRYNEVVKNQFKRVNEIINDETKSLGERLKELFRRDGLTIGAILTAIGMTIATIVSALRPTPTPGGSSSNNSVKKILVKISNWLLDLAKKALSALPGIIGSVISFLLQKAGELVLFFSEHLLLLILTVILVVSEYIFSKIKAKTKN